MVELTGLAQRGDPVQADKHRRMNLRTYYRHFAFGAILLSFFSIISADAVVMDVSHQTSNGVVTEIREFSALQALADPQVKTSSLVMICGFTQSKNSWKLCGKLVEMLVNMTTEHPAVRTQRHWVNASQEIDREFFTHMRYRSDPQFIYIKEGRLYYYAKHSVTNAQLVEFMAYFDENPDFMYRSLSNRALNFWDNMLEGLYRILDKTQVIFGSIRPALYFVYIVFVFVGLMLCYAVYAIFEEAITGKRYGKLGVGIEAQQSSKPRTHQTSEDLKVKKD